MQYFGVPKCPYCKKRVNVIRTWSLKKQGEYKCPRCGGISNIYLSPLIYVFAVIAIFVGVALFFFHRFVLNDIGIKTGIQIVIPFAIFFFLSLFMVYLKKPVINRGNKNDARKQSKSGNIPAQAGVRSTSTQGARRTPVAGSVNAAQQRTQAQNGAVRQRPQNFRDDDYMPQRQPQDTPPMQRQAQVQRQASPQRQQQGGELPTQPRPQQARPAAPRQQMPARPQYPEDMEHTAVVPPNASSSGVQGSAPSSAPRRMRTEKQAAPAQRQQSVRRPQERPLERPENAQSNGSQASPIQLSIDDVTMVDRGEE